MTENRKIRVGISVGDLNGVGVELILKTFEDKRMLELVTPVIFASEKVISYYKKVLKLPVQTQSINGLDKIVEDKINILKVWQEEVELKPGTPTPVSGEKAFQSFEAATEALKNDEIDFLLTCPISKENIQSEKFKHAGHTSYLDEQLEGDSLMILMSDAIKVGLVTEHIPISKVSETLNANIIKRKINAMYQSLQQDFSIPKPKIAVLGLNPHCGDNGLIGKEDDELIMPILKDYQSQGRLIYGPYAADGFFGSRSYEKFDGVISMYHDQGLVGFKALSFGEGVNFTTGLNKVRVSPDHGTAFGIAGQGKADISSFKEALFNGLAIFKNRNEHKELTKSVLKSKK